MNKQANRIKGLGEVSIRVQNLDVMEGFYKDVVGLEVLRKEEKFVFFNVGEGYGGHTQNLALFDAKERTFHVNKSVELNPGSSSLHHIALNVDLDNFEFEKARLLGLGLEVQEVDHPWIHVRSLYFSDPEGNLLEYVSYDESL